MNVLNDYRRSCRGPEKIKFVRHEAMTSGDAVKIV